MAMAYHPCSSGSSDWENLPKDVLGTVLDKVFPFVEYTRCGLVCKSWLRVTAENYQEKQERLGLYGQIPLLMSCSGDYNPHNHRTLYNIITNKAVLDLQLPIGPADLIRGSCNGWVAIDSLENSTVTLFNPIRNKSIQVRRPSRLILVYSFIVSARNNCSPIGEANYVIVLRCDRSEYLVYIRSGDEDWTYVVGKDISFIEDAIFYKGNLYFLSNNGGIFALDVLSGSSKPKMRLAIGSSQLRELKPYIAKSSSGDLLLFQQYFLEDNGLVSGFRGFRMQHLQNGEVNWVEMRGLDDDEVVFLGNNGSTCVKVPNGHLSNSVCYIDDFFQRLMRNCYNPNDRRRRLRSVVSIFNLADGSLREVNDKIDPLQKSPYDPIWVFLDMPNFRY